VITVKTSHEESDIQALIARVLENDTFFLALRDAQPVTAKIVLDRS
jgi:translation initiation factor IF-1